MPRRNCNADYHRSPMYDMVSEGYKPMGRRLDVTNPPQGGSRLLTTPEAIVRAHRISSMERRIEALRPEPKRSDVLKRIIKIFFWVILGWAIGYFHYFFAG